MEKIDYMFIGVHPDDIEIGCGGTVKKLSKKYNVMMVDLTEGEMGSNGNRKIRLDESKKAAEILDAIYRINLGLADTNLKDDDHTIFMIADIIRKYRPENIVYPYEKDYHPDHEYGSKLIRKVIFKSGLIKYKTDYEKYRPIRSYCYYINDIEKPTFFVDISDEYEFKIKALKSHESQFLTKNCSNKTYLNSGFIDKIMARDRYFGSSLGCEYAEPLYYDKEILVDSLDFMK
ncbi:MAG: bacillithiol biosynthesis deacetylase BshB1 [Acidaminobacteraceae bacterium]